MTSPSPQPRFPASRFSGPELSERPRLPFGRSGQSASPSHAFVPADSIFPRIAVTRQTIKKLETIHRVRKESRTAIPRWLLRRRHYAEPRFRPGLIQISTPGAPDS